MGERGVLYPFYRVRRNIHKSSQIAFPLVSLTELGHMPIPEAAVEAEITWHPPVITIPLRARVFCRVWAEWGEVLAFH